MAKPFTRAPVPLALRPLVDEAVHSVLEGAVLQAGLSNGSAFRCADYAILGARVLGKLTGHGYIAVAGKAIVDCGGSQFLAFTPPRMARRRAVTFSEVLGYHCWIESLHPMPGGKPRLEIVDFTVRHDWAAAKALGVPFTRDNVKLYLWDWSDALKEPPPELHEHFGTGREASGWMWADAYSIRLLRKYETEYAAVFERLASLAIISFCDSLKDKLADKSILPASIRPADPASGSEMEDV
jgi:hypothetical protein